jgi:hypothetical protein
MSFSGVEFAFAVAFGFDIAAEHEIPEPDSRS